MPEDCWFCYGRGYVDFRVTSSLVDTGDMEVEDDICGLCLGSGKEETGGG